MKINALVSSPSARDIPESSAMALFFRDSLDRESLRDPYLLQVNLNGPWPDPKRTRLYWTRLSGW